MIRHRLRPVSRRGGNNRETVNMGGMGRVLENLMPITVKAVVGRETKK